MRNWLDNLKSVGFSLVLHLGFAALIVLGGMQWPSFRQPQPVVFATVMDFTAAGEIQERETEAAAEEQRQREEEAERQRQDELERQRREEQAEQDRQQDEERLMELERLREQQREEREAERRRMAQQERERQEEERRQREEEQRRLERQREEELERIRRQREEAERQRLEEQRRLEELAERRRLEEQERETAEAARREREAAEQAAAAAARGTLSDQYQADIRRSVTRNWIRPTVTNPGVRCNVRVFQIPGGEIIDAQIASPCNADDTTQRSIINAVNRTGELPYRGYEDVFEREIVFTFIYDG